MSISGVHQRTLLIDLSLLLALCPICTVRLIWVVCEMGSKCPYAGSIGERCLLIRPCFFGSVPYILFVLLGWFVRWEVSGHVGCPLENVAYGFVLASSAVYYMPRLSYFDCEIAGFAKQYFSYFECIVFPSRPVALPKSEHPVCPIINT